MRSNRAKVSADPLEIVKAVQQVVDDANEYMPRHVSRAHGDVHLLPRAPAAHRMDGTDRQTEAHGKQLRRRTEVRADPHQDEALI